MLGVGVGVEVVAGIGIRKGGRPWALSLFVLDEEVSRWVLDIFGLCVGVGNVLASNDVIHLVFSDVLEIINEIEKGVMNFSDYCERWIIGCCGDC